MNIHSDLDTIKLVAVEKAKQHKCNYNIVILNPNAHGEFDEASGSTYEFVADSYFDKPRPNVKILFKTNDLPETQNPPRPSTKGFAARDEDGSLLLKSCECLLLLAHGLTPTKKCLQACDQHIEILLRGLVEPNTLK